MPNITPTGSPSWVVSNSFTDIAGHLEKENITGVGPVNPKQDYPAEAMSRLQQMVEAAEWSMPFATIRLTLDDAGAEDPTVLMYRAQHGVGLSLAPTVTRLGDGSCSIAWEVAYQDSFNVSGSVNITAVQVSAEGASVSTVPSYTIEDGQTVYVYGDTDGSFTVSVWTSGDS